MMKGESIVLVTILMIGMTPLHGSASAVVSPDEDHASIALAQDGLIIDLDADKGVTLDRGYVASWESCVGGVRHLFEGRRLEGRPTVRAPSPQVNGHHAILFVKQELVDYEDDLLDGLTTGSGYTWVVVIALGIQQPGWAMRDRDVNAFFGNLRNGPQYDGFWAGVNEDGTVWAGPRNGRSFGRWNDDNPKLVGPTLSFNRYYVVAGRLGAGQGSVPAELFVNTARPVARRFFPVSPDANPERLAIGQERDAINHPGKESFIGAIARFAIWKRPLSNAELARTMSALARNYHVPVRPPKL